MAGTIIVLAIAGFIALTALSAGVPQYTQSLPQRRS